MGQLQNPKIVRCLFSVLLKCFNAGIRKGAEKLFAEVFQLSPKGSRRAQEGVLPDMIQPEDN